MGHVSDELLELRRAKYNMINSLQPLPNLVSRRLAPLDGGAIGEIKDQGRR
ncbi:MAG: hypothetical protein RLZZ227_1824 [Pseudomonadota bacterium]|jgi:hypothetical protein